MLPASDPRSTRLRHDLIVLRAHLDEWVDHHRTNLRLTSNEIEAVEGLAVAFAQLLVWIERCPGHCIEAMWWDGGSTLDALELPLADVVNVCAGPTGELDPVRVLRGLFALKVRVAVIVSPEWRLTLIEGVRGTPR